MRTNDLTAARHHGLMAALTGANVMTFANKVDDLFWCRYLKCQWRVRHGGSRPAGIARHRRCGLHGYAAHDGPA